MKKNMALILLCCVASDFASEQHDSFSASTQSNSIENQAVLEENIETHEQRRFYAPIIVRLADRDYEFKVSPYFYYELTSLKNTKGFLSIAIVKRIPSINVLIDYTKNKYNAVIENIAACEKILNDVTLSVGEVEEWLEFDQLTTIASQNDVDRDRQILYKKAFINAALRSAEKIFPHVKIVRTYLKESERDQIDAYSECGFIQSSHQYMDSEGLIVYEKKIN